MINPIIQMHGRHRILGKVWAKGLSLDRHGDAVAPVPVPALYATTPPRWRSHQPADALTKTRSVWASWINRALKPGSRFIMPSAPGYSCASVDDFTRRSSVKDMRVLKH